MTGTQRRAEWQRVAAYAVCRDDAARLLLTRLRLPGLPHDGAWTMPGGGLDWGEQPADAALRELDEETGLSGRVGSLLGVWSHWLDPEQTATGRPGHAFAVLLHVHDLDGELRTEFDDGSTDAVAWFTTDEIAHLRTVPLVDEVLRRLG